MKRTHLLTGIFASAAMLILILDGQTALSGAQTGISLCIKTVIPSLFPFFLLSILLTGSLSGNSLLIMRPLERLTGIPNGAGAVLLSGFLGGYPTGAQCIAASNASGNLTKQDAERMLSFCNNAGPAFLFGMVSAMFENKLTPFLLWGIHIFSALLVSFLLPSGASSLSFSSTQKQVTVADAMHSAISAMATVCGWVVLFRVVIAFLDRWFLWMLPVVAQVLITGILELSNGCCELSRITVPEVRFVVCACLLSLGGLCVAMQTRSVTSGLSLKPYLKGKLIQTLFSLLLSISVVLDIWAPVLALLLLLTVILQKAQKRGRNPAAIGV